MKPGISLTLAPTATLALTPQLQQALRLLQLSTLEFNAEVERMLQENPLLDKDDDDRPSTPVPLADAAGSTSTGTSAPDEPAGGDEGGVEARDRTDSVDRTDFEDYSGGESEWGGGARRKTTRAWTISRLRRARCATTCSRS